MSDDLPEPPEGGERPAALGLLQGLPRPLAGPIRIGFLSVTDYLLAEVDRTGWPQSFAERDLVDCAGLGMLKITLFRRGSFTGERFEVPAEAVASCAAALLSGVVTDLHQTGGADTWDVFVAMRERPALRVAGGVTEPEEKASIESEAPEGQSLQAQQGALLDGGLSKHTDLAGEPDWWPTDRERDGRSKPWLQRPGVIEAAETRLREASKTISDRAVVRELHTMAQKAGCDWTEDAIRGAHRAL
jgi:hypothetical protein